MVNTNATVRGKAEFMQCHFKVKSQFTCQSWQRPGQLFAVMQMQSFSKITTNETVLAQIILKLYFSS